MKDSAKKDNIKPGLEEALHPEIGNEAPWTQDPHAFSLSTADPLKSLDSNLFDEESLSKTILQWNTQGIEEVPIEVPSSESTLEVKPEIVIPEIVKQVTPSEIITEDSPTEEFKPGNTLEQGLTGEEEEETGTKKGKKKKDKGVIKVSKLIKKAAKQVKKDEEKRLAEKPTFSAVQGESSLTPFTHWLKGLTGSEYVHPYEADFGFNQGAEQAGEGISETFADLLAAQGYKDRAIAMYTLLIEKFPEKSRFFAAKIEALQ
jgi:hypothetical protein